MLQAVADRIVDERYRVYDSTGHLLADGLTIDAARETQRRWNSRMRAHGLQVTAEIRRLIVYEIPSE